MAPPIQLNKTTRNPRAELHRRLEEAPEEHAEALLAGYEVLQGLHDRGVLDMLRGALGSSDHVIEIAVDAAQSPEAIRGLRNMILLSKMLGEIEPERLSQLTNIVPQAINPDNSQEPPGLFKILWTFLWNKDIRRALWHGATVAEAFGRNLSAIKAHSKH